MDLCCVELTSTTIPMVCGISITLKVSLERESHLGRCNETERDLELLTSSQAERENKSSTNSLTIIYLE